MSLINNFKQLFFTDKRFVIVFIFFLISLFSFIFSPITGDVFVFFASSQQADYIGENYVENAFKSWELKGVFLRAFFYFIYKGVSLIAPLFSNLFAICSKLFFSIFTIVTVLFFTFYGIGLKKSAWYLSCIICSAIFATAVACHMQAEMIIVIILTAAFLLYINACRTNKQLILKLLLTGFLIGSIFFFKSVFILMSVSFAGAMALYNSQASFSIVVKHIITVAVGACIMLLSGLLLTNMINPYEMQEMINAAVYQTTLFNAYANRNPFFVLAKFGYRGIISFIAHPFNVIAFFISCLILTENFVKKQFWNFFLRLILWFIPFLIVCLANQYFLYHYMIFLFVFIVEITLIFSNDKQQIFYFNKSFGVIISLMILLFIFNISVKSVNLLLVSTFVCFLFASVLLVKDIIAKIKQKEKNYSMTLSFAVLCCIFSYLSTYSIFSKNFQVYRRNIKFLYNTNTEAKKTVAANEVVMYLDDGQGAFILGNKSFLKEYYPLPLQRLDDKEKYKQLDCYRDAKQKALSYTGTYITVFDDWFFSENKNLEIKEKILAEYTLLCELTAYTVPFNMFSKNEYENFRKIKIYKRR